MRTSLTSAFTRALLPPDCEEVGISLLDITSASLGTTYHICDNNEDIVSNGVTYSAWAFELAFCDETEGEIPSHSIVIDNTNPEIFRAIRSASARDRIEITHKFVIASDPDTNQLMRPIKYQVADIEVDEVSIVANLILAVVANENFPAHSWLPSWAPALFASRSA